ncbi:hypothetical protein KSP39_PZI009095 [Platanthera zijinensis]|uniref:RRM domain-containing protein n=1 Tax=Platanthera zijinensis TaxID=2320716 RepID=A0AAP0BKJ8_9ASPA
MEGVDEYRYFIGGLSLSTTNDGLKDAFRKFGHLTKTKVVIDKFSGRSRGFGFVIFDRKSAMEAAIDKMNGMQLDGRSITVSRARPHGWGRDRDGRRDYDRARGGRRDCGHHTRDLINADKVATTLSSKGGSSTHSQALSHDQVRKFLALLRINFRQLPRR